MVRGAHLVVLLLIITGAPSAAGADAWPAVLDSLEAAHHRSDPARVDSLARPAIAAARREGNPLALSRLLLARGRTRAAFGLAREAEPDLREAVDLARARADTASLLRGLRWLAVAVGQQGRSGAARGLFDDLERLAMAHADSVHLGWAWVGVAYDEYLAGRSDAAADRYRRAAGVLGRAGVGRGAIWARLGEGLARRQGGDYVGAAAGFRAALDQARLADDALNEAVALNHLGRLALAYGDPGQAEALLGRARQIHAQHRHHREALLASLDLAQARHARGRVAAAVAGLDSALASCRDHGLLDLELIASCRLADIYLDQGQPGRAAAVCRAQRRRPAPSTMADTELRLRLARALADRDSVAAALAVLPDPAAAGARSLEVAAAALRGRLLVRAGRAVEAIALLGPVATPRDDDPDDNLQLMDAFTALAWARLAHGEPAAALEAAGQALDRWERARAAPADPRWRERRGGGAAAMVSVAIAAHLEQGQPAAAHALVQRYKVRTFRELAGGQGTAAGAALAGDARSPGPWLAPGDVLLDLVAGPERVTVFCVTADTIIATQLEAAPRRAADLVQLTAILTSKAPTDAGPAVALASRVLAPVGPAIRQRLQSARRLLWCPDGPWHRLPPALLVGEPGWLPADCEVVRVPAADLVPTFRERLRMRPPAGGILAVAGQGRGLAGARAEVRWLASRFRDVHVADPANPRAWPDAGVLHLAAHVEAVTDAPWQASLDLGQPASPWSGVAEASTAPLVVLAGCRTAGESLAAEGLLGLGSGFLIGGASSVVATLWDVDDRVTARVMADFYAGLAHGRSVAGALAWARQRCRARPETAAPRHWAGFVVLGDGTHAVPIERQFPGWPVSLVLLGAALLAFRRARNPLQRL
jgi:predicted negative regulator of RcsB-dependent stress response